MHRHFLRINSQIAENVEIFCNNGNTSFHFECRKWILDNQSP